MENTFTINKERLLKSGTNKVWNVLTNPTEIKKWLGVDVKSKWTQGSDILFSFEWDGKGYVDKGRIIHFEKEKVFSYFYWSGFSGLSDMPENYSKVEFLLKQKGSETLLKLNHSSLATETMYKHSNKNWEVTLNEIKMLSESLK